MIERRVGHRWAAGLPMDRWKMNLDNYVFAAGALYADMQLVGFDSDHPVPVDLNGELLDGSHRVACALALGIDRIAVERRPERVWAPAWDAEWFRQKGLEPAWIAALSSELKALHDGNG